MNEDLTFKKIVEEYCMYLSDSKTSDLNALVAALPWHPRLKEPLLIYAMLIHREEELLNFNLNKEIVNEYKTVIESAKKYNSVEDYLKSEWAPKRYNSVYNVWAQYKIFNKQKLSKTN